jgi:hypothetical protein
LDNQCEPLGKLLLHFVRFDFYDTNTNIQGDEPDSERHFPIPSGISIVECADLEDEDAQADHPEHDWKTALSFFDLPLSSDNLFFISRGPAIGNITFVQADEESEDVSVMTRVNYQHSHILNRIKVCKVRAEDGENGLGIFVRTAYRVELSPIDRSLCLFCRSRGRNIMVMVILTPATLMVVLNLARIERLIHLTTILTEDVTIFTSILMLLSLSPSLLVMNHFRSPSLNPTCLFSVKPLTNSRTASNSELSSLVRLFPASALVYVLSLKSIPSTYSHIRYAVH